MSSVKNMIVSMTGFGDASIERSGTHYSIEIRSLNNRFFKPVIKLPDIVAGMEPEIETLLRDRLVRGSITCILKMRVEGAEAAYLINQPALQAYVEQLNSVKGLNGIARIDLASLLSLPGVCQEPADDGDHLDKHGPVIRQLIDQSIGKLSQMRQREGQALFEDLLRHAAVIAQALSEIEKRAPFVIDDYHRRLSSRVAELLSKAQMQVAQIDLLKEVAVFAERSDISEEIQRLRHHLASFEQACRTSEHAGRKLDFITQEMLRETNTIGSKANDALIAGHVVDIKGSIDRMKEQVQNVE
ncbi:MAG: YicC family protein [Burkholderiales bacterium]|nr:YicC family protein [Phycisphaerae bacterium]